MPETEILRIDAFNPLKIYTWLKNCPAPKLTLLQTGFHVAAKQKFIAPDNLRNAPLKKINILIDPRVKNPGLFIFYSFGVMA